MSIDKGGITKGGITPQNHLTDKMKPTIEQLKAIQSESMGHGHSFTNTATQPGAKRAEDIGKQLPNQKQIVGDPAKQNSKIRKIRDNLRTRIINTINTIVTIAKKWGIISSTKPKKGTVSSVSEAEKKGPKPVLNKNQIRAQELIRRFNELGLGVGEKPPYELDAFNDPKVLLESSRFGDENFNKICDRLEKELKLKEDEEDAKAKEKQESSTQTAPVWEKGTVSQDVKDKERGRGLENRAHKLNVSLEPNDRTYLKKPTMFGSEDFNKFCDDLDNRLDEIEKAKRKEEFSPDFVFDDPDGVFEIDDEVPE